MQGETKDGRFRRLAERRVNRAIKDVRSIGNLANRSNYEYTTDQIRKIVRVLRREVGVLEVRFREGTGSGDGDFKL